MMLKLTSEQRAALQQRKGPVEVEDEETHRVYFLADREDFQRVAEFLRREEDVAAIQAGMDDYLNGRVCTLQDLEEDLNSKFRKVARGT